MASRALIALGLLGSIALFYGCGRSGSGAPPNPAGGGSGGSAGNGSGNSSATGPSGGSPSGGGATGGGTTAGSSTLGDAGAAGATEPSLGPKPCTDETELGAVSASTGARVVKSNTTSPGKTAALLGFSATNVSSASNALLWARYSGAMTFRSFGSVPPNPNTLLKGNVTTQAAFLSACQALAGAPTSSPLVDLAYISDYIKTNPNHVADVLGMAAALDVPVVLEIKTSINAVPLLKPADSATDFQQKWEVWKNYFAVAFVYARDYGVSRFEIYNEPDLTSVSAYSEPADYAIRARLAGDAIQAGVQAANVARKLTVPNAAPLSAVVIAPTTTRSMTEVDYGNIVVSNLHNGPLGTPATNPSYTMFQAYGYHNYGGDGAAAYKAVQALDTAVLKPAQLTLPWYVTEFNAECTSCEQDIVAKSPTTYPDGPLTYAGDLPDFSRRLTEKAIAYAESNVGPANLYAFNFLSLETPASQGQPLNYTNNGLYWATSASVIGGDSLAGAAYRLLIKHFGGARPRLGLDFLPYADDQTSGKAPDTLFEAVYDERYDAYFIAASNRAAAVKEVFFDLSSLALPPGTLATVIDVDTLHHGEVTHRVTLSAASTFEIAQQPNAVTLVSVPRTKGTISGVGAIADTTLAPGAQSGMRFGADTTLQLAADSTNTSKLRTALLAFTLPDLAKATVGEALLELALAPGAAPSPDVIHVYGVPDTAWSDDAQTGERWSDLKNLRAITDKSQYAQIDDNAVQFIQNGTLDPDLRVAATGVVSSNGLLRLDVTDYVREQTALGHVRLSLLLVREVNHHLETIAYSAAFRSRESACGAPSLTLRSFQ